MADRYWIASSSADFNNTANWSTTSGGAGGASVPTTGDNAIYDGNGVGNCNFNASPAALNHLNLSSGYTGTVTFSVNATSLALELTVATGATLNVSNKSIKLDKVNPSGGTITGTTGTITVPRDLINLDGFINGATFNCTVSSRTDKLGQTLTLTNDNVINGDFIIDSGNSNSKTVSNTGNLTIGGDINFSAVSSYTKGTGTITLSGSSAQSINFDGESVEDIVIDKTSQTDTVTLTGGVTTETLTITSGKLDVNAQSITSVGAFSMAAGTSLVD